ncbi:hypothetical protein [Streptomyces sp. NPDC054765]
MSTSGADQQEQPQAHHRGHVLLIAGDQAVHRRRTQILPSQNLAALTVVPTPVLLGSNLPTDATHLDGVRDQNSVLQRLRVAAATPGPLLIYLSGRLTTDRKARRLHLALPGTTATTVRYTSLPWEWLRTELRPRPPGSSTLLVDLAADKGAWEQLQADLADVTAGFALYGVISPPGFPGTSGVSDYTRALIEALRSTRDRPPHAQLHAQAVAGARVPPGTLVLPTAPAISPAPAAPERQAAPGVMAPAQERQEAGIPAAPQPLPDPTAVFPHPAAKAPLQATAPPLHMSPQRLGQPPVPALYPPPGPVQLPPTAAIPPQAPAAPMPARDERERGVLTTQQSPPPVPPAPVAQQPAPAPPVEQQPAPVLVQPMQLDPRPIIWQAAQDGRHNEAAEMAAAWEQQTLQQYGPDSPQAILWAEIRADLARIAEKWTVATQLWVAAARARLAHQAPDAPEVLNAARGAHYCWQQIEDPAEARSCGPELIALLRQLPDLDHRHLPAARQRMEYLQHAPTGRRR